MNHSSPLDLNRPLLVAAAEFYDRQPDHRTRAGLFYRDALAALLRQIIPSDATVLEIGCGGGHLLARLTNKAVCGVDLSARRLEEARRHVPHGEFIHAAGEDLDLGGRTFDHILVSDTLNLAADVQQLLERARRASTPRTRLTVTYYNTVWRPLLSLATLLGLRHPEPRSNWLSRHDVHNLLELAGWQVVETRAHILCPVPLPLLATLLNRWAAPLLPSFCLTHITVARPAPRPLPEQSVTVVIPARNEAGNIAAAVSRLPRFGTRQEIIFMEGGSSDNTWEAIQKVVADNPGIDIKAFRQTGRGKGNAVREAFARASGDILMILDADLTMPPEELPKYYGALVSGTAEFANGVRLVYPMEQQAMRFLNMCANKFFSVSFSWVLGQPVKDTLCGTKVLFRKDYEKIAANRAHFGDFDPFGDFDLLFGANRLRLKFADIPIRYRDRTYGSTNIQRWRHGWMLLRMLLFAAARIRFI